MRPQGRRWNPKSLRMSWDEDIRWLCLHCDPAMNTVAKAAKEETGKGGTWRIWDKKEVTYHKSGMVIHRQSSQLFSWLLFWASVVRTVYVWRFVKSFAYFLALGGCATEHGRLASFCYLHDVQLETFQRFRCQGLCLQQSSWFKMQNHTRIQRRNNQNWTGTSELWTRKTFASGAAAAPLVVKLLEANDFEKATFPSDEWFREIPSPLMSFAYQNVSVV